MNIEIPEFSDVLSLEAHLSEPGDALVSDFSELSGDSLVLGAGVKMGPTLAKMARKAMDRAGCSAKVIAVARFSDSEVKLRLELLESRLLLVIYWMQTQCASYQMHLMCFLWQE